MERPVVRWWNNVRGGRMQRTLALSTALSALPLGLEIYFEHFRGSFGDKWMWTPVALSPALSAGGVARRPGGFQEPLFNIVMGPPLLAPGSLALVGGMGLAAAALERER